MKFKAEFGQVFVDEHSPNGGNHVVITRDGQPNFDCEFSPTWEQLNEARSLWEKTSLWSPYVHEDEWADHPPEEPAEVVYELHNFAGDVVVWVSPAGVVQGEEPDSGDSKCDCYGDSHGFAVCDDHEKTIDASRPAITMMASPALGERLDSICDRLSELEEFVGIGG